jgi:hypothetical protein
MSCVADSDEACHCQNYQVANCQGVVLSEFGFRDLKGSNSHMPIIPVYNAFLGS